MRHASGSLRSGCFVAICAAALGVAAMIAPASAAAQERAATLAPEAEAAVDSILEAFHAGHRVPGLSVGIVKDGRIVYAKGFGATAPSDGAKVTAETTYRLASVTKPFTSVAVLQLAGSGALGLDDPAGRHCPPFHGQEDAPTVRQLLAHQGGLRHTTDREDTTITGEEPLAESVRRIAGEERAYPPGEEARYSSWGYAVLGCVIEEVTGQRYVDYLAEHVFDPAGMTATVQDRPDFDGLGFSPGWRVRDGELVPSAVVDTRFKVSASGLISSVVDLSRFAVALYEGSLLGPEATRELFEAQATADGDTTRYTLGWIVPEGPGASGGLLYGGSMEGSTALVFLLPDRCYALSILTNRERFVPQVAPLVRRVTMAVGPTPGASACP